MANKTNSAYAEYRAADLRRSRYMKKAKPEHRRDYWKYHFAMFSFEQCADLIERLMHMRNSDPLFYPLMTALHVMYARPFCHDKESRNVESNLIPNKLLHVHSLALHLRDKLFAHHDTRSKIVHETSGEDLSQLVVRIRDGNIAPGLQTVFPTENQLSKMLELCRTLYKKCQEKGKVALEKCISDVPPDGIYMISTPFEGKAPLFGKSQMMREHRP